MFKKIINKVIIYALIAKNKAYETIYALGHARNKRMQASSTAEYAIALLAAVGFAALLVAILRGDEVKNILTNLVKNALNSAPE